MWLGRRHPHADKSGYAWHHRLVAAYELGRKLLTSEHVHHEDEDKANNEPGNFRVYECAYHGRLHASSVEVANAEGGKLGEIEPTGIVAAWRRKWLIRP